MSQLFFTVGGSFEGYCKNFDDWVNLCGRGLVAAWRGRRNAKWSILPMREILREIYGYTAIL